MARKEVLYFCEICNKSYGSNEKAQECEDKHYVPIQIGSYDYEKDDKKEYPMKIRIKVKNGNGVEKVIEYSRK